MQLLELNDLQLNWFTGTGQIIRQPGAALIENDSVVYGAPALDRSRLAPRGFQDQHWQLLNSDSLALTAPGVQNNADLIFRQLKVLADLAAQQSPPTQPLICAVPGTITGDQLSLLLGIAQEAGVAIGSFANSALLYALNESLPAQSWCIDIQNRQAILTELQKDNEALAATNSTELPLLGMSGLIDGWLDLLVDQFVARSRFDPLRVAETEQQLFDQVRAWHARQSTFSATVDHQNSQREVSLSFDEISDRAQQRYRTAHDKLPPRSTVVLTPAASALPGFAPYLSDQGHSVINARADAPIVNALAAKALTNPAAVHLLTSLGTTTATLASDADNLHATHALNGHTALPLARLAETMATLAGTNSTGFHVTAASDNVHINGEATASTNPLRPGDSLQVDDATYTCIRVNDGPAA